RLPRLLRVVRGAGVPALGVLVVLHVVPGGLQGGGHLARVAGVHAVVAGRGGHEHRWVATFRGGCHVLVGRVGTQEVVPVGRVGAAALRRPGGPRGDSV